VLTRLTGTGLGIVLLLGAANVSVMGLIVWAGARVAGVRDVTYSRSAFVAAASSLISITILFGATSLSPVFGGFIGAVLAVLVTVLVIREVLRTDTHRAILVWGLHVVIAVGVVFLTALACAACMAWLG
jgi:hypothetical protein